MKNPFIKTLRLRPPIPIYEDDDTAVGASLSLRKTKAIM